MKQFVVAAIAVLTLGVTSTYAQSAYAQSFAHASPPHGQQGLSGQ